MKIIYYSPHPHLNLMSPSGSGTHMREMIAAFRNEQCEVLPVVMGGGDNPPEETLNKHQSGSKQFLKNLLSKRVWRTVKDLNLLRFDYFTAAKRIEKAIKKFNPDFIYERCYYLQLSGIKMAKKYGLPHVLEINSPFVDQANFLGKSKSYFENYARYIEKKQVHETDLPLAVVGPLKEYFAKRHNVPRDKFLITHDAFNPKNIQLNTSDQKKIQEQYQLFDKKVIGYIGSIFEWHGLDKLIRAFDEMKISGAKVLIVGYGAYMTTLMKLAKNLAVEDDIIFTGRVPKEIIFNYIDIMDICVAPNAAWYQSPVKIFEYGAMGKPILGPDTEAVREVMIPDEDGILVEPSINHIKAGLRQLLKDPERAKQMGLNFRKKVLQEYTWGKNAKKVLNKIEKLEV